jgi:hypothetical protein
MLLTWIAVTFGLMAKSIEGAGVFSYLIMLLIEGTIDNSVWVAIVWCVGIWITFHIAAMRIYKVE